jgi:hypothetical protein
VPDARNTKNGAEKSIKKLPKSQKNDGIAYLIGHTIDFDNVDLEG